MDDDLSPARHRDNLRIRAGVIQALRQFFIDRHYLEVDTPLRIPAPAPEIHIDAIPTGEWFLHTSPELCMKRLLAQGYDRIFQISKCFRHGERGDNHLSEFTLLEWYRAGIDYRDLMRECEDLFIAVARFLGQGESISYRGAHIDLRAPWRRITVREAFEHYSPVPLEEALATDRFDEMLVFHIEPRFNGGTPVILYDYPISLGALARTKPDDATVAERFEIYLGGLELANAFSELTNAGEQRARFEEEHRDRAKLGKTNYPMPEKFLHDLETMPEAAGIALGVDRLVMLFADSARIDDVVTFTPEEL
jgi:lysyl-tRNA synthetase class 2